MKPRRVVLTIEVVTDAPLGVLRCAKRCEVFFHAMRRTYAIDGDRLEADIHARFGRVLQVQASVVK